MAKQRKGISKALKKGKVESGFTINESPDDDLGFGTPKTKEKSLSQAAKEQNEFNSRYSFSADVNSKNYDNSKGEVPEEYAGAVNSWSDYRMVPKTREEDKVDASKMGPESSGKSIPSGVNYTSPSSSKSDKIYNNGFNVVDILRRKGYHAGTIFDESDRPTLDNPMGKGLDPKMDAMPTNEAGTVSPTQGQSLVTAIKPTPEAKVEAAMQNDNTGAVLSNAILKDGTQSAETANQVFEAPQVAKEAQKEAEKEISALDDVTAKVFTAPYGSFDEEGDASSMGTGAVQGETTQTQIQEGPVPGSGEAITTVVGSTEPTRPAFDATATKDQIMNMMAGQYMQEKGNVPYAVVEKLGIQDYYPNVGRDIAVGTFSGSRIGSQTIYSGAGASLPMGLYDARKRALKDAAKSKQAELDKILAIPDTTPQLKESFSEYALKVKYDDLARNGFDPARYGRDLQARKNDIMLEATAKNLTYATKQAQDLLAATMPKDGKPGAYMPEEQKKKLRSLLTGVLEDPEKFFSGKENVNKFYNDVRVYADGTVLVNDMIKQWTSNPVELPVNLKTGVALSEADVANINAATDQYLKSVNDGNPDTESYMTMMKKYYDIDTKVIDDWMDAQQYSKDDPMRDTLKDYLKHQIPAASFIQKVTTNANQNVARARLQLERDKFNYQKEQDKESFWGTINASMNDAVNTQTGKTFEQELAALNKRGLDKDQLDTEIKKLYNIYSVTPSASITKSKDGSWVVQMPSTNKQAEQISTKDITAPNGKLIRGFDVTIRWKDGNTIKETTKTMGPAEIAKYKASKDKTLYIDGKKLGSNDFDGFGASSSGIYTKVIGHEISKGYIDKKTGNFVPLTSDNLADYEASTKVTLQRTIEHPYAKIQTEDAAKGQSKITERILPGQTKGAWINISNADGRILSDEQSGFTIQKAAEAQGPGTTVTASGGGEFASF